MESLTDGQQPVFLKRRRDPYRLLKLLAFLFPFLTVISAFALLRLYPVGDRTMLTVDLYHQYAPFLYEFRTKLLEGRSLFYSFTGGMGNEYFAAYANYTASPLNLLVIFCPYKAIPVFIAIITAIRAGLASLFMTLLLSSEDRRRFDYVTVVFGSIYALNGWFLTEFWNIMWCDAYVMLPIIILGLRKLFLERKYFLYIGSLALTIISNYYTGWFICLFLVFFSVVYYFALHAPSEDKNDKNRLYYGTFFRCAGRFAFGSAVAGMMSAFMVVPTYMILQHSSATGSEFPKQFELTGNLFDFLARLMVTATPSIRSGMANISCGVLVALLIPLFFLAPRDSGITLRTKIGFGFMLALMYLSFSNRMLDFIWHGFHFPNQIPYRESFLMSFLLVYIAFRTIRVLRRIPPQYITAVCVGAFVFLVLYEKFGDKKEGYLQIGLTLLFLLIQGSVLRSIRAGKAVNKAIYEYVITFTVFLEMFVCASVGIGLVAKNEGFTGYDFYGKNRELIHDTANDIEGTEGHLPFERTELFPNNICNIQSVYDVKGISIFSSTARESFVKYMRNFGFHNNNINGFRNAGITRVTASLLNVRNFATIEPTRNIPMLFEEEYNYGDVVFYGNEDALPVGFMVSEDILSYEPDYSDTDVFHKTNDWIRSMGVEADVYLPIDIDHVDCSNLGYEGAVGNSLVYTVKDKNSKEELSIVLSGANIGEDVYIYIDSGKVGTVRVGNEAVDKSSYRTFEVRSCQIIYIGKYEGEPIEVSVSYNTQTVNKLHVYAYQLNTPGYEQMLSQLGESTLDVTYYDDTTLQGRVNAAHDGLLFMSIAYTEGFTLTVDGVEAEITPIADALCGIRLPAGTHNIELKYEPAGLTSAILISLAGAMVFVLIMLMRLISVENAKKAAQLNRIAREEELERARENAKAESALAISEQAQSALIQDSEGENETT